MNTRGTYRSVCYIAGPMTGYPGFNYRAFDHAKETLESVGWDVISPADLDRENLGLDFSTMDGTEDLSEYVEQFARQDLDALLRVHAVFVLDGWESSTGARNETSIAAMLGVPVFSFKTRELIPVEGRFSNAPAPETAKEDPVRERVVLERTGVVQADFEAKTYSSSGSSDPIVRAEAERDQRVEEALRLVGVESSDDYEIAEGFDGSVRVFSSHRREMLDEAANLVDGDRNAQYGDPRQDFRRTAELWSTYLDGKSVLDLHDVAAMMALLKLSRIRWSPEKRDSWVDLAGYAACGWDCARPEDS